MCDLYDHTAGDFGSLRSLLPKRPYRFPSAPSPVYIRKVEVGLLEPLAEVVCLSNMAAEVPTTEDHGGPKQSYTQEVSAVNGETAGSSEQEPDPTIEDIREERSKGWFAYLKTRDFYILLVLGFVAPQPCYDQGDN